MNFLIAQRMLFEAAKSFFTKLSKTCIIFLNLLRCPTENCFYTMTKSPARPSTFHCIMVCCMGETIYTS